MQFFVVYVREAHAIDGISPLSGPRAPLVVSPVSIEDRGDVAHSCMTTLALNPIPMLVDGMDDAVSKAWEVFPSRLYLVGRDGNVAYRGAPGPAGLDPEEFEEAIEAYLSADSDRR